MLSTFRTFKATVLLEKARIQAELAAIDVSYKQAILEAEQELKRKQKLAAEERNRRYMAVAVASFQKFTGAENLAAADEASRVVVQKLKFWFQTAVELVQESVEHSSRDQQQGRLQQGPIVLPLDESPSAEGLSAPSAPSSSSPVFKEVKRPVLPMTNAPPAPVEVMTSSQQQQQQQQQHQHHYHHSHHHHHQHDENEANNVPCAICAENEPLYCAECDGGLPEYRDDVEQVQEDEGYYRPASYVPVDEKFRY